MSAGEGGVNSDDPAVRSALEKVAGLDSPNRSVYQDFLDLTSSGSASETDVAMASLDLISASVEDSSACI